MARKFDLIKFFKKIFEDFFGNAPTPLPKHRRQSPEEGVVELPEDPEGSNPFVPTPEIENEETVKIDIPPPKEPDMRLEVTRFSSQNESTLGFLSNTTSGREFLCFTIEDEFRTKKVYGETRIPGGTYKIKLRKEGGFNDRYLAKFGADFHKGMLWLQDVPNFEYVLIHIGNSDDDSAGCLLVGDTSIQNITEEGMIGSSTSAYKRIYPPIAAALENGEDVEITYVNYDNHTN